MEDDPILPVPSIHADEALTLPEDGLSDTANVPENVLASPLLRVTMHGSNPIYKGNQKT